MVRWVTLTDVGLLEGRGVVDAVSCHGDDVVETLTTLDDDELLLRGGSGEDDLFVVGQNVIQLLFTQIFKITSSYNDSLGVALRKHHSHKIE